MKKNFPCILIERHKTGEQFYLDGTPIHPDRLFVRLSANPPEQLSIKVYKNNKLFWNGHYFIKDKSEIEKYVLRAYKCRV